MTLQSTVWSENDWVNLVLPQRAVQRANILLWDERELNMDNLFAPSWHCVRCVCVCACLPQKQTCDCRHPQWKDARAGLAPAVVMETELHSNREKRRRSLLLWGPRVDGKKKMLMFWKGKTHEQRTVVLCLYFTQSERNWLRKGDLTNT